MTELEGYEIGKKMLFYVCMVIVILIIFVGMIYTFRKYVQSPLETDPRIYVDTYLDRFLSSPDCFAYQDSETDITYTGMIDKSKFSAERLNRCFVKNDESLIEFSFNLIDQGKDTYIETENFGALQKKIPMLVLVNDKGEVRKAELDVGIGG